MKNILITGVNGQLGSYLAESYVARGYNVWGIVRRQSYCESQTKRIDHILDKINLVYGDVTDFSSLMDVINKSQPDYIINTAAQSHVRVSFDTPIYTQKATGESVLNLLEAVRNVNKNIKIVQMSSSEMFGNNIDSDGFQRETTPMDPVSPYGCAKLYGYNITRNYRRSYGMWVSNIIAFNFESPRRGTNFVTNKVCKEAVKIYKGMSDKLKLGNLHACRDWNHALDTASAIDSLLHLDSPDDFVCASGKSHSVEDLCREVFTYLGIDDWEKYVEMDPRLLRPEELHVLKGDSSKLQNVTGWTPKYDFKSMIHEMVTYWKGCNHSQLI